ncbi:GntR family transcriptional regulator [Allonocardiopsis opalescens]|uniref:DNA-binding GntR family transcriptional regulator n=1 Tax=Allonocardiopsis opalescens TaxID=1144618 RepID=A0A2T0Q0G2_9ACTN|nr:GntR family transcriptional regulator [Allonocardiopsis opalescens]PRX97256.1 DNA-binding GntR family transcriptional regulator [Allonocardiopsis opalescens]
MTPRPDRPQRVGAAGIYQRLRAEISEGALPPGTPLREVALAERFGVSRTPVREALRRLQHDRLLAAGERGLHVRVPTPEEVLQVYDARILLEAEAAGQAATARSRIDLARLDGLLARDRALSEPDDAVRAATNIEFHEAVWRAAHNAVLLDLLDRLTVHTVRTQHSTLSSPGRWTEALEEHAGILAAIADGEVAAARERARAHMSRARDIRLAMVREESSALRGG